MCRPQGQLCFGVPLGDEGDLELTVCHRKLLEPYELRDDRWSRQRLILVVAYPRQHVLGHGVVRALLLRIEIDATVLVGLLGHVCPDLFLRPSNVRRSHLLVDGLDICRPSDLGERPLVILLAVRYLARALVVLLLHHVTIEEGPVAGVYSRPEPVQDTPGIVRAVVCPSSTKPQLVLGTELLEDLGLLCLPVLDVLDL